MLCTTERGPNGACKTLELCAAVRVKTSANAVPTCIAGEHNSGTGKLPCGIRADHFRR
jgi:hypothetical protein